MSPGSFWTNPMLGGLEAKRYRISATDGGVYWSDRHPDRGAAAPHAESLDSSRITVWAILPTGTVYEYVPAALDPKFIVSIIDYGSKEDTP